MRYRVVTHESSFTINARSFSIKGEMVVFLGGSDFTEVAGFPAHMIRSIISDAA